MEGVSPDMNMLYVIYRYSGIDPSQLHYRGGVQRPERRWIDLGVW